jgi:GPI-anchor transamidase subunit GAA1
MRGDINYSGVALALTLARYFKRWSLWSKDIIILISGDSTSGPQAWVDAYHNGHDPNTIDDLAIKSGALQGAVAIDYPAGPWGHRYDKLHIEYDGVNGQLPNLDLFNTAIQIASGQMGIGCALQRMWQHSDSYKDRLHTMLRGMLSQGLGRATGPHSAFIPYHVDAITLVTVGDGWHDEMSLGRAVESLFRSLNNLLEHLHQSFFFYLLLEPKRFVSIGTYLPSAMLVAANFSIMAIALWVKSGRPQEPAKKAGATEPAKKSASEEAEAKKQEDDKSAEKKSEKPQPGESNNTKFSTTVVKKDGDAAVVPTEALEIVERSLFFPLAFVLGSHFLGLVPLFLFNYLPREELIVVYIMAANITTLLPIAIAFFLRETKAPTPQQITLIHSFSLLLLGMFLSALATLNFSLSIFIGVLMAPLSFIRTSSTGVISLSMYGFLTLLNPLMVIQTATKLTDVLLIDVLLKAAEGWHVWGMWTQVAVFLIWWPAWFVGSVVVALGFF